MNNQNTPLPSLRGACNATRQSRYQREYSGLLRFARNDEQSGNALIFILIAIALLGLLTVTMTRSGDSTNDTGDYEQNQIAASEILGYAKSIENAVQQLLARGCSENELSFENSTVAGYTNANSPTDNSCHVFEPEGAGMTYQAPNEDWLDNSKSAETNYLTWGFNGGYQIIGAESNNTDLIVRKAHLEKEMCYSINQLLSVNNTGSDVPTDNSDGSGNGAFTGSFTAPVADTLNDDAAEFNNKRTFCRFISTSSTYQFIHVLHAR